MIDSMRIGLITYEYPPDTAVGGIATYAHQAAVCLADCGHDVEVFAGSPFIEGRRFENGVTVNRIRLPLEDRHRFRSDIVATFSRHHAKAPFDVIEGSDFAAEAIDVAAAVPEVALVTKLHMGMFSIRQIEAASMGFLHRFRRRLGAIRRKQYSFWDQRHPDHVDEWRVTKAADEIVAPSAAMADWMLKAWSLERDRVSVVPNPYTPSNELLQIPLDTDTRTVTFIGRLELRKGVLDLFKAIPAFLARCPDWTVRFVGRPLQSPIHGVDMSEYGSQQLAKYRDQVHFLPPVPLERIGEIFSTTDLCVFPSLWENFPNVCLEAMSAGRGVVASSAGGMAEQLNNGECGLLVPPAKPQKIADALIRLALDPKLRVMLGEKARRRAGEAYRGQVIGPMLEASYSRAIRRCKDRLKSGQSREACLTG